MCHDVSPQALTRPRDRGNLRPRRSTRRPAHARPARRTVARRRTRRLHARLHQHRPNPVTRRPIRSQTTHHAPQHVRRQVRNPNPGQQQKAVVGQHLTDVQTPRARVPTQVRVARTQPQRRRHEAQHPHRTRCRRQQIRQTTARRTRPAERMRQLQQPRAPLPSQHRVRHQQPDLAQFLQAATELGQYQAQPVHPRPATATRRTRLGRRQRHTQLIRQVRQRLASRRRAQLPPRVAPPVPRAQSASQSRTRQLPPIQLLAEPLDRLRLQNAQTNPHAARSTQNPLPVSTVIDC